MSDSAGSARPLQVLVTDSIMSRFGHELRQLDDGTAWTMAADWTADDILAAMPETDVLVCSSMTSEMAAAAPRLRLVHVTGAGFDKIPLDALGGGVAVANTFHHGRPIAEHVMMVSLMLSRRVRQADREMRSGRWRTVANDPDVPFHDVIAGQTLGVIGLGGIGQEVARLAAALGMRVQAVRQNPSGALPDGIELDWVGGQDELPRLISSSDVLVVTIPLSESTRGLIGAEALAQMRPTGILVNVARGAVVDEDALFAALTERRIASAAIDVWWGAPSADGAAPPATSRFAALDNVILTPHHSGHAKSTFVLRAGDIAANVANLAHGRELMNVVRRPPV